MLFLKSESENSRKAGKTAMNLFDLFCKDQEMKLDAYKTAGEMYEEIGDLENAAEMYSYSYDCCLDKSMDLFEKIAKRSKSG